MTGIVSAACAVPEWMKKLITHWIRNITCAMTPRGSSDSVFDAT